MGSAGSCSSFALDGDTHTPDDPDAMAQEDTEIADEEEEENSDDFQIDVCGEYVYVADGNSIRVYALPVVPVVPVVPPRGEG